MDFLAHFSTVEDDRNGSFSMLVSAPDIDSAIGKFKKKILQVKKSGDLFDSVRKVFLEVIVRINKVPEEAAITRYESRAADSLSLISISPVDRESLEAFNWCPDDKINEEGDEIYPFVEFSS